MINRTYKNTFQWNQNLIQKFAFTVFNILGPRQHGRHFDRQHFRSNDICCNFIHSSLQYVSNGRNDKKLALVQTIAWHQTGYKPFSKPIIKHIEKVSTLLSGTPFKWYYNYSLSIRNCRHVRCVITYRMETLSELLILYEHWPPHKGPVM